MMAFTSKNQNSFSKKIFTILTYSCTYACVLSHVKGFSHSNLWKGDFLHSKNILNSVQKTKFSTGILFADNWTRKIWLVQFIKLIYVAFTHRKACYTWKIKLQFYSRNYAIIVPNTREHRYLLFFSLQHVVWRGAYVGNSLGRSYIYSR